MGVVFGVINLTWAIVLQKNVRYVISIDYSGWNISSRVIFKRFIVCRFDTVCYPKQLKNYIDCLLFINKLNRYRAPTALVLCKSFQISSNFSLTSFSHVIIKYKNQHCKPIRPMTTCEIILYLYLPIVALHYLFIPISLNAFSTT